MVSPTASAPVFCRCCTWRNRVSQAAHVTTKRTHCFSVPLRCRPILSRTGRLWHLWSERGSSTRAEISADRALSIDPDLVSAANWKIAMVVEKGDIETAYLQAKDILKRRPDNGDAHFTMSLILRKAGL